MKKKKDRLNQITHILAKHLPDEPWREGETSFSMIIPLASDTDNGRETVPNIRIDLNQFQYEYIKANTKGMKS